MKVLFVASEVSPIVKLGGLGDVIGSLPKELEKLGIDVDVAVPFYPVANVIHAKIFKTLEIYVPFRGEEHRVDIYKTKLPSSGVDVLLFKNDDFFSAGGTNAFADSLSETEMFSFFNRGVVEYIKAKFNTYDVVHCHDWHTGLVTHILQDEIGLTRPATVLTIHNLSYQGTGNASVIYDLGIIPGAHPVIDWDISDGDLNLLQQGLASADMLNAVSPTYAQEILTEEFGGELRHILLSRSSRVRGILNGIDYSQFPRDFDRSNFKSAKATKKARLREKLGLTAPEFGDKPLFGFVSRLDPNQKGLDILYESIPNLVKKGAQFVLLGKGDPIWEQKLLKLVDRKSLRADVSIQLKFDVDLAIDIYAAADFFLVPSRFEPCGLTQMISMWYGTIPVVHNVGGLKDSVKDSVTGVVFKTYSTNSLSRAISRAVGLYSTDEFPRMVRKCMTESFDWGASALQYSKMYEEAVEARKMAFVID